MRGGVLLEDESESETAGRADGEEKNQNRHAAYLGDFGRWRGGVRVSTDCSPSPRNPAVDWVTPLPKDLTDQ
ncbi:hypothetical protein GCM10018775_40910 [Streptomyces umbrinus]|nr:hypothetical protein GCM10018775_40910 [Streptomyces umbrinus]